MPSVGVVDLDLANAAPWKPLRVECRSELGLEDFPCTIGPAKPSQMDRKGEETDTFRWFFFERSQGGVDVDANERDENDTDEEHDASPPLTVQQLDDVDVVVEEQRVRRAAAAAAAAKSRAPEGMAESEISKSKTNVRRRVFSFLLGFNAFALQNFSFFFVLFFCAKEQRREKQHDGRRQACYGTFESTPAARPRRGDEEAKGGELPQEESGR